MLDFFGFWLVPVVMGVAWLVGMVATRGRVPMWSIVAPVALCMIAIVVVLAKGTPQGPREPALGPPLGLLIYAFTGIFAGLVIAVLNGVVQLVRYLMDRQQRSF